MRTAATAVLTLLAAQASALRIIQGNDDGWAEMYLREFHKKLDEAGHKSVISAPAENQSGKGGSDDKAKDREDKCQYDSCPANAGSMGSDKDDPSLNWVNGPPVTALKEGIETFGPQFWHGEKAEFAVTGPNVGLNILPAALISGTMGAAAYAAHEAKLPTIAFSAASTGTLNYKDKVPLRAKVYSELAADFVQKVIRAGLPYVPEDTFLNVNYPEVEDEVCNRVEDFKYVFARINIPMPWAKDDVKICSEDGDHLPTEAEILGHGGCLASVAVADAKDKTTASAEKQQEVYDNLKEHLVCFKGKRIENNKDGKEKKDDE